MDDPVREREREVVMDDPVREREREVVMDDPVTSWRVSDGSFVLLISQQYY